MDGRQAGREAHLDFVKNNWRSSPSESSLDSSIELSVDMEQKQLDEAAGAVGGVPPQLGPRLEPRIPQDQQDQDEIRRLQEKLAAADGDHGRIANVFHSYVRKNLNAERSESIMATQQISDRLGGMEGNINQLTTELQRVIVALGQQQQQQQPQQPQQQPQQRPGFGGAGFRSGHHALPQGEMLKRLNQAVKTHDTLQAKNASAFAHWWEKIEAYLKINECDRPPYLRVAMCFMYSQLSDELQTAVKTIRPYCMETPVDPTEYAGMLKAILLPAYTPELQLQLFLSMTQQPKQTLADYFNRLKEAYTGANMTEFMQFKAQFVKSLKSKKIK